MSTRLLFIMTLLLAAIQVQAVDNGSSNNANPFYDNSTQEFSAPVGMFAARAGYIHFADAGLPPDPNTPVDRNGNKEDLIDPGDFGGLGGGVYSVSIDGEDSDMFSARVISMSTSEKGCTVSVIYSPTAVGTHHARLVAYCSNAGSPYIYINLVGEGRLPLHGDVDGDGSIGINDVSTLIDMLLNQQ